MPFDLKAAQTELKDKSPQDVLAWALKAFPGKIKLASSFGAEDVALIDMLVKLDPKVPVFTLDTGRLNEETYEVMDRIRAKYKITIESYFPDPAKVEALERSKGFYSFRESVENRKECCGIRKVEPLKRALSGLQAWVTGLRREQSVTRTAVQKVEADDAQAGLYKVSPLADWSEKQVWEYVKANKVPYNRLHDLGYPSIGCAPCTRAVPAEGGSASGGKPRDIRSGRWWWESAEHKECGLHKPKRQ